MKIDGESGKPEEGSCDVDGNPDLYGLGVRLGIYFQWLGSYLSNLLLPGEISTNLDANSIFLLALFVAVAKGSFDHSIGSIDALVLLELSYGYFFSVLSLFGFRSCFFNHDGKGKEVFISTVGTYLRIMLTAAVSVYAVWFWFDGVEDLQQAPCEEVIFFFGQLEILKSVRTFFKFASIVCLIYYGTIALVAFAILARFVFPVPGRRQKHSDLRFWEYFRSKIVHHPKMPLQQRGVKTLIYFLRALNFVYLLWAAVTVGLTLNWNHVKNTTGGTALSTTGQQLPTIIGAFTFLRVLWLLWKVWREEKVKSATEAGEDGEEVDVKLLDLGRDGESYEEGEPMSTKMTRTLGKNDTAYRPVPVIKSLD